MYLCMYICTDQIITRLCKEDISTKELPNADHLNETRTIMCRSKKDNNRTKQINNL